MPTPDMTLANAILKAAENLGADGKGKDGVVGWLEAMRWTRPDVFAQIMAKAQMKKENPNG